MGDNMTWRDTANVNSTDMVRIYVNSSWMQFLQFSIEKGNILVQEH